MKCIFLYSAHIIFIFFWFCFYFLFFHIFRSVDSGSDATSKPNYHIQISFCCFSYSLYYLVRWPFDDFDFFRSAKENKNKAILFSTEAAEIRWCDIKLPIRSIHFVRDKIWSLHWLRIVIYDYLFTGAVCS